MSVEPEVLARIKKLLALSKSSNVNEAAVALRTAQRMMEEHNLTTEAVEVGQILEEGLRSVATATRAKAWELRLYKGVAQAFGCELYLNPGSSWARGKEMYATWMFVGPSVEVKLSVYASHVLQRQLVRARAAFTRNLPDYYSRSEKSGEVDSYCSGWVDSALEKVSPLVPNSAKAKAIENHLAKKKFVDISSRQNSGSLDAMDAGLRDGKDVELNRPVSGHDRKGLGSGQKLLGGGS